MNSPDPFEERLARTPFRPAPSSLRQQVLQAAAPAAPEVVRPRQNPMSEWIAHWLWPRPAAWGTLGLAWLIVLMLNVAALDSSESIPLQQSQKRISPAWTAALREQHALLRTLLQDPPSVALRPEPGPDAQLWRPGNRPRLAMA